MKKAPLERVVSIGTAVTAITLLAFALRVYHLSGQSLWYDEGFSVYLAQKSLSEIAARTAADIQPPVYYFLLHFWLALAGRSEYAVRFLSVFFGTLTIPLVYVLARRLVKPWAAVLSALFIALSPFQVWYSQETRMYTLVTMLGVLSSYLLLRALHTPASFGPPASGRQQPSMPVLWLAFALTNILAIYTHYYAFFLVAFQAIFLLAWWLWQGRPRGVVLGGLGAVALTVLAYLPWAGFALNRYAVDQSYWQGALSLDFVRKTLLAFAAGLTVFESQAQIIAAGFVALALLSVAALCIPALRGRARERGLHATSSDETASLTPLQSVLFLLLYLVVPFILLYLLSAWRPKFNPRYLMLASPPLFILIAAGLEALVTAPRRVLQTVAVAGMAFVLGTSIYALANNYANRVYARDDFRSVALRIANDIKSDEAIILSSGHMFPVFDYYYPGGDQYRIPDQETLSTSDIVTYDVAGKLNEIAATHGGAWLVSWQDNVVDPNGILSGVLDTQAEQVPISQGYWGVTLRHYRFPPGVSFSPPSAAVETNVDFDGKITLLGYSPASPSVASGATLPLTLYWQAQQAVSEDYWLALRLVDSSGHVWGRSDQRPASYTYPTNRWQVGTTIPGPAHLPVTPGTPPGAYSLQASLFSPATGQSLTVLDAQGMPAGTVATLGTVQVTAPSNPPAAGLGLERPVGALLGSGIELAATNLQDRQMQQGEKLPVAVAWRKTNAGNDDYQLRLRLLGSDGAVLQETVYPLGGPQYASGVWPAGSVVRGQYDLTVPANAPSQVSVEAALLNSEGQVVGTPKAFAGLTVAPLARVTAPPAMQNQQQASFGNVATLLGYDIAPLSVRPGEPLDVTLYWQTQDPANGAQPLAVFTHLLGSDGRIYGQHDGEPANGERPTTGWQPGEYVTDRHRLAVQPDALAGSYTLEVGLYDPATSQRLEATEGGQRSDHVLLSVPVRVQK